MWLFSITLPVFLEGCIVAGIQTRNIQEKRIMLAKLESVFKHKYFIIASIIIAAGALASVYIMQYFFGILPCKLCNYQRVPYALMIAFSSWALFAGCKRKIVLMLIFLWSVEVLLAGFHSGVEYGWWDYDSICTAEQLATTSLQEFKNTLQSADLVSCKKPNFWVLGLTLAVWNFLFAFAMLGVNIIYLLSKWYRK
jgi:disulfide bond formation protein DsbB